MSGSISDIHLQLAPHLITGLSGTELTPAERELLSLAPPAGVILFHRNVESIDQLRRLTGDIRNVIEAASGMLPLVMADHEGGRISVLAAAIGAPPSPMAAWAPRSREILSGITASTASKMSGCGINVTLSPAADVASEPLNPVIGTRSYGEDPDTVSEAVRTAVQAIAGEGMLSCLKHFPGHGSTVLDSHLTLPVVDRTVDQLREVEIPPFRAGIGEMADMVMTAHIALTGRDMPASLDRGIITEILREELGFTGVVITDALEMAGVLPDGIAMKSIDPSGARKAADAVPASIAAKALEAGNDLLLMSRPVAEVYAELGVNETSLREMLSGVDMEELMERSSERIAAMRKRISAVRDDVPGPDPGGCREESLLLERLLPDPGAIAPALPVFLGEKKDFESYVVRRFIFRLLGGIGHPGTPLEEPIVTDDLRPVMTDDGRESGLFTFEPVNGPDKARSLVLVCRRPPPGDVIRGLAAGFDSVVAAERPWDAVSLPPGTSAVVTYGTFDAAADRLAGMLQGP